MPAILLHMPTVLSRQIASRNSNATRGHQTMRYRHLREQNRRSWNAVVQVHNSHRGDQVRFFREGGLTLFPEEHELLGDVAGRSLVHLMCNSGQDTLSLARLGARVTGVDISDAAIEFACRLSTESGIPASFCRADVYDWLSKAQRTGRQFDVVFSSYGVICWLSDLDAWAAGVAAVLRPGGRLVAVDFHPVATMFDENWDHAYPYSGGGQILPLPGVGDYVGHSEGGLSPRLSMEPSPPALQGLDRPVLTQERGQLVGNSLQELLALLRRGLRGVAGHACEAGPGECRHRRVVDRAGLRQVPGEERG